MNSKTEITKANYNVWTINEGDRFSNINGKKVGTYMGRHDSRRTGRTMVTFREDSKEYGWIEHYITEAQFRTRFPVKLENVRSTVTLENLTNDELEAVKALLAGRDFTITRTK